MVTQIQLGNFFSANGRTVLGGVGGSGLDTESLIKALTDARSLPATRLQDKIDLNEKRSTALNEFQQLLSKFKDAANFLRNPPGINNAGDNVFRYTTATITSNTSVAGSSYVAVTSSPGATIQSYKIDQITSVARAKIQSTETISVTDANTSVVEAVPSADEFKAGTFTLNGQNITFAAGDSLNTIAAKMNAVSDLTGISATVIKVSNGNFRLSFAATETGEDADFDFNNVDVPGTLVDGSGVFANITVGTDQNADNAIFQLNDVEITRQSNSISDVVDGITFNILQTTPALTEVNVSIRGDDQIVKNGIINLANAYNDLKIFAAEQTQLNDDGTFSEDSVLANNQLFRTTMNNITSQLASIVNGISGSNPSRLADIGITFTDLPESQDNPLVRNILTIDEGKLASAIATNFDGVRRVFEFDLVANNPNLRAFAHSKPLGIAAFTLNIDTVLDQYQVTYTDDSGPHTINLEGEPITGGSGYLIEGVDGTVLEGLQLIFTGSGTASINVTATQGLADKVFNTSDVVLKQNTGSLAVELESIKTADAKLQEEIDRINAQVEKYREELLAKFGALEAALSRVNTLLQSLDAQAQARQNAS
jgi:flagellar hook-associated protein 2